MLTGALLLGIGLVAAGARLTGLDAKPLWLDETLSWRLQSLPLGLLLERTGSAATVHPPLYFVILHVWTPCFGDSHFALRLPSALFGVLSVLAKTYSDNERKREPRKSARIGMEKVKAGNMGLYIRIVRSQRCS